MAVLRNNHILMFGAVQNRAHTLELSTYALPSFSHFSHFIAHGQLSKKNVPRLLTLMHVLVQTRIVCIVHLTLQPIKAVQSVLCYPDKCTTGFHQIVYVHSFFSMELCTDLTLIFEDNTCCATGRKVTKVGGWFQSLSYTELD